MSHLTITEILSRANEAAAEEVFATSIQEREMLALRDWYPDQFSDDSLSLEDLSDLERGERSEIILESAAQALLVAEELRASGWPMVRVIGKKVVY